MYYTIGLKLFATSLRSVVRNSLVTTSFSWISYGGRRVGTRVTELNSVFEAFLAGDDAAFAELYRELNPRLSAYCHKLVRSSQAGSTAPRADDLMQELWERVIAMRSRAGSTAPRGVMNPTAFLFRMLKNLAIDEHRKTKNEISIDEHSSHETHESYGINEQESQESDIECIILEALEKLSPDDREVLVLNIYSGYNFGEIAEMLEKSPDAIWQRASRARAKLRKIVIEDAKRLGVALPRMNGNASIKKNEAIV